MVPSESERRVRRSDDPITALHYQLAHARHRGGLEAMVLVDGAGSLVAGAGAWPVCEELAAYAPLLAGEGEVMRAEAATALEKIRPRVRLKALWFNGAEVLLAARGAAEQDAEPALGQAASGCLRILGAGA